MTANFWVVYVDSNPANVKAFFKVKTDAQAYQAALGQPSDLAEAHISEYTKLQSTVVALP